MSLEIRDLSFSYGTHGVLSDISFSAEYGQVLSVLGPNGVGKSTLFRCILGLLRPQKGDILMDSRSIRDLSPREMARKVAYIPQSHNPVFNYSVFDMVLMGTTAQTGTFSPPRAEQERLVEDVLSRLGISHLRDRRYASISGGERQLTLIARAMAQQAKILVMDEPSAALDYGNRHRVMEAVRQLASSGYAIVQSTHDPDQAFLYSDRILALHDGRILAWGTPKDTVERGLISRLYGVDVEIFSLREDAVRVCVPKGTQKL